MDEIAAEAATSKTVIYRHFGDRQGLYLAVCESVDTLLVGEIKKIVDSLHDSTATPQQIRDITHAVIDGYLRIVEKDPEVYQFVVRRPQVHLPDGTDPVTGLTDRIAMSFAELLAALAPEPATSAQFRITAWALVGLVKESADRWLADPDQMARAELAQELATFCLFGLIGRQGA